MTDRWDEERRKHPLRYRWLTEDEKRELCNGCGGKGGAFNPPDYRFKASCDHHDLNYWIGYREEDRLRADRQFLDAMLLDASAVAGNFLRRWWLQGAAWRYYWAVRWLGDRYFHYGSQERTWLDLDREMGRRR